MKVLRDALIVVVLLGWLVTPAEAQGFKWWHDDKLKAEIGLTSEQIGKLDAVFQELIPKLNAEKSSLDTLDRQLSDVMRDANVSEAEVMRQVEIVEAARSTMGKTRTLMIYRLYRTLTPEQRQKVKALHQKWEEERRRDGRRRQ